MQVLNKHLAVAASDKTSAVNNIGLRGLLVGFALVALLVAAISAYGVFSSRQIQEELHLIVSEHSRHIELLREMGQLYRTRKFRNSVPLPENSSRCAKRF